jgi:biopolymer transport protein ExbB/TolQ
MPASTDPQTQAYSASHVAVALTVAATFAAGTLILVLHVIVLQPVRDTFAISEDFLNRFARNLIIQIQFLLFLIGLFYLMVRLWISRRDRNRLQRHIPEVLAGATATDQQRAVEQIDALIARAEAVENSRLSPLSFVVWALPILGFLGTVIGVSAAIKPLSVLVEGKSGASVAQEILGHLLYAFDTTLTGLVFVMPLMAFSIAIAARIRQATADFQSLRTAKLPRKPSAAAGTHAG